MATFTSGAYSWPAVSVAPTVAQLNDWVQAIIDTLAGCGCVQTADTGQLVPGSLPAWPANPWGYLVFRFDDAAQATDPVFFKLTLGRGGVNLAGSNYTIQFGQGSNGSGTLTGNLSTSVGFGATNNPRGTSLQDYACHKDGSFFFGSAYGDDSTTYSFRFAVSFERSRLADGTYDGQGASILYRGFASNWRAFSWRYAGTPVNYTANNSFCLVPNTPADTARLNGDKQLYPHWYNLPEVRQRWSSFTVRRHEFGTNPTSFTASPFNAAARTFLSMGNAAGSFGAAVANATDEGNFVPCFLWE
jgi:hypothetical protein